MIDCVIGRQGLAQVQPVEAFQAQFHFLYAIYIVFAAFMQQTCTTG